MIHRPQQQRYIIGFTCKRQTDRISLPDRYILMRFHFAFKHVNIMLHQFNRVHGITPIRKRKRIPACAGADFRNAHTGAQILFNIPHGGDIFNGVESAVKSAFLVICIIILFYIVLRGFLIHLLSPTA